MSDAEEDEDDIVNGDLPRQSTWPHQWCADYYSAAEYVVTPRRR